MFSSQGVLRAALRLGIPSATISSWLGRKQKSRRQCLDEGMAIMSPISQYIRVMALVHVHIRIL
ncbi:hypothetical protein BDV11DRAFT_179269 [Aspergillus similis]